MDLWTVVGIRHEMIGESQEIAHAFMILSQRDSTMVISLYFHWILILAYFFSNIRALLIHSCSVVRGVKLVRG